MERQIAIWFANALTTVSLAALASAQDVAKDSMASQASESRQLVSSKPPSTPPKNFIPRAVARKSDIKASDLEDGIALTDEQKLAMDGIRDSYWPRMKDVILRWTADSPPDRRDTTVLNDSLRLLFVAQRSAMLTVLTPEQRARYDTNEQKLREAYEAYKRKPRVRTKHTSTKGAVHVRTAIGSSLKKP